MSQTIVVIFGSRDAFPSAADIERGLDLLEVNVCEIGEVVCGMARGADLCAQEWARGTGIHVVEMPADWNRYGQRAGFIRNREMAEYAHCGLGFWRGESRGTANMIAHLVTLRKPVEVIVMDRPARGTK